MVECPVFQAPETKNPVHLSQANGVSNLIKFKHYGKKHKTVAAANRRRLMCKKLQSNSPSLNSMTVTLLSSSQPSLSA